MDVLTDLSRAIELEGSGAGVTQVLEAVLSCARVQAGPEASVSLFLLDESGEQLQLVAPPAAPCAGAALPAIASATSSCGRAALRGQEFIVEDVYSEQLCAGHMREARQQGIRSCWSLPVRVEPDKILGALSVSFHVPTASDPVLIDRMKLLAGFVGLVVKRHRDAEHCAEADAQLRESESRYRSLTKTLTSIVWSSDCQGRFVAPQPSWQDYTGQAWEQQQGYGWLQAIHQDDRDAVMNAGRTALEEGRSSYLAEGRVWHAASGRYRYCESRGMPVFDVNGHMLEWVGTCVDVDDQKRAAEALREADRRKDEFMAVLAHELRNPLAPIRNALHILKSPASTPERTAWAAGIAERQVAQMARLLDDLLDVSRVTRGKLELRLERVALSSILEVAAETSRPFLEQHGHEFEFTLADASLWVNADPGRLAQVFSNLLNNAAKYTDRGGVIRMMVRAEGNEVLVTVSDNGIGIAADVLPQLFHMYSQVSPGSSRALGGLGIGLALVRGLVEMHGGSVQARSEGLGCGTEVIVRLPLAAEQETAPGRKTPIEPTRADPALRVLVADDNEDAVDTMAVLLRMMGHQVRVAADGHDAVRVATDFIPHVVLLDLQMPRADGFEAARRLRELLPHTRLIAITGFAREEDAQRAAEAGFHSHLCKPVDPAKLAEVLGDGVLGNPCTLPSRAS